MKTQKVHDPSSEAGLCFKQPQRLYGGCFAGIEWTISSPSGTESDVANDFDTGFDHHGIFGSAHCGERQHTKGFYGDWIDVCSRGNNSAPCANPHASMGHAIPL